MCGSQVRTPSQLTFVCNQKFRASLSLSLLIYEAAQLILLIAFVLCLISLMGVHSGTRN